MKEKLIFSQAQAATERAECSVLEEIENAEPGKHVNPGIKVTCTAIEYLIRIVKEREVDLICNIIIVKGGLINPD